MPFNNEIVTYQKSGYNPAEIVQQYTDLVGETAVELVACVTNQQVQVMGIIVSTDTPAVVQLTTTSTGGVNNVIATLVMAAAGGAFQQGPSEMPLFAGNIGGNLRITLSVAPTNGGIYLQYRMRSCG